MIGVVAYSLWLWRDGNSVRPGTDAASSDPIVPAVSSDAAGNVAADDSANASALPAPGSMEAALLNTTPANRVQMLTLAISDARYECPPGASVNAVGSNGAVWRVHCGESNIYLVEVNEYGRLQVTPLPYGDFIGGAGAPRRQFESDTPSEQREQIELQERMRQPVEPR